MEYISVKEAAKKWNLSDRSVRNYCANGKIPGAILHGNAWKIPEAAKKPARKQRQGKVPKDLLARLRLEKDAGIPDPHLVFFQISVGFPTKTHSISASPTT